MDSLSNTHSQSTEEAKATVGYSSQLQIYGGNDYLKTVLNEMGVRRH